MIWENAGLEYKKIRTLLLVKKVRIIVVGSIANMYILTLPDFNQGLMLWRVIDGVS